MSDRVEAVQKLAGKVFGTVHGPLQPQVVCDHGERVSILLTKMVRDTWISAVVRM